MLLEGVSGFVIVLASEEPVEVLSFVDFTGGVGCVEECVVSPVEPVPLLKFPSLCTWGVTVFVEVTAPVEGGVADPLFVGGVVIVVESDVVESLGALGVEGGGEGGRCPTPSGELSYGLKTLDVFNGVLRGTESITLPW
ncbi:hypothetical protein [Bartonella sp. AU55XJBT]|uniref:hypothetical protein n=1 Tax=Bartonella sp. AU55XJBT TaxID=3019091 RepID=UPI00235E76C3